MEFIWDAILWVQEPVDAGNEWKNIEIMCSDITWELL
jgi:hypothetical protein